jgi:hypothetical protein
MSRPLHPHDQRMASPSPRWFYLGSILALVFGYIALSQIKGNPQQGGRGMAVAGVVLGWIGVSILALTILLAAIGSI